VSFDLVVCQFGFMFVPDKPLAFREARRVLAPGGLLLANVWHSMNENPFTLAIQNVLDRLFPADPPRFLETPYGYHDTKQLLADMAQAGWENVKLEDTRLEGESPSADDFATGFVRGSPLTHSLADHGANLDTVTRELARALIPVGGNRPFRPTLNATVITATR
jgi:SAM-dependent methyltransferase